MSPEDWETELSKAMVKIDKLQEMGPEPFAGDLRDIQGDLMDLLDRYREVRDD